jgi:uncharacterized protein (TIGR01244 family)
MQITQLSPAFSVSGQIGVTDIADIAAAGFSALVNNRPDGEAIGQPLSTEVEAEAVRLGLRYYFIPVEPGQLTDENARRLAEVMQQSRGPILAFCRSGARSTNLWKAAQRLTSQNPL